MTCAPRRPSASQDLDSSSANEQLAGLGCHGPAGKGIAAAGFPRLAGLVDGSIEKTRVKYHANDGVNLYGQKVDGVLIGQGTGS